MSYFSLTLSDYISKRDRSFHTLAKYSGLDASFVFRLTTGEKNPSLVTIVRLTDAFFATEEDWVLSQLDDRDLCVDRDDPEYIRLWYRLVQAATKDAVAKQDKSRRAKAA